MDDPQHTTGKQAGHEDASAEVKIARRGLMLVISSPSGAGKTTLAQGLLAADDGIEMSVSLTTRPPRPGEVDGRDYIFVDRDRFLEMRAAGALLESAEVFGNFYGTPKAPVLKLLEQGRDVLFDIDWQGAQQLQAWASDGASTPDLVRVFILPPSGRALAERLRGRAQDPAHVVEKRMAAAANEISHWAEYDYVIVNEDIAQGTRELQAILAAERLKRHRRPGLSQLVDSILHEL